MLICDQGGPLLIFISHRLVVNSRAWETQAASLAPTTGTWDPKWNPNDPAFVLELNPDQKNVEVIPGH